MLRYNLLAKTSCNKLIFTINDTENIHYEKHSYIIPIILKEKYSENKFNENDFRNNLKFIGNYFYMMFIEDYKITSIEAKIIFKKKFPHIKITDKDIN